MATNAGNHKVSKFLEAMASIYGPFPPSDAPEVSEWTPPAAAEGHRGRYLWTDGFAVVNFLSIYRLTNDNVYLTLARNLVTTVHNILGFTRDGTSRLPGASDAQPLNGGLRIGKHEASGPDGDGQYFHYLTVWMFALNRMTHVTGETWFNNQAVSMAKAILPKFTTRAASSRPRMVWKMSTDLTQVLVPSEGNLDPICGYVMYQLLQETVEEQDSSQAYVLKDEITLLKKIVDTKWRTYTSTDTLDIGMTLWTVQWLQTTESWAVTLRNRAVACLQRLVDTGAFDASISPARRRLAFREFGTALGAECIIGASSASWRLDDPAGQSASSGSGSEAHSNLQSLHELAGQICATWEE